MHQRPLPRRRRGSHRSLPPGAGQARGLVEMRLVVVGDASVAGAAIVAMVMEGAGAEVAAPAGGAAALVSAGGSV